ncbi:MAG: hypothetical protein ACPLOC_03790 [Candidatus Bathyarchaeales archaeon]
MAEFVEIKQPVEYDLKRGVIRRYYRYGRRYFDEVDADMLQALLDCLRLKKKPALMENPNELVLYQYPKKPLIVLDVRRGCFLTTRGTVEHFGWKAVRHQASIVLRILKKFKLSKAKRVKVWVRRNGKN